MYIVPRGPFWVSLFYPVTFRLVYGFQPYRLFHHHHHGGNSCGCQCKPYNISHWKYTPWGFPSYLPGTDFPSLNSRNHHILSAPYQSKVTTPPVAPSPMLVLDGQQTVNPYMVVAPYSTNNILLLILGGVSYSLWLFVSFDFNRHVIFTKCSIYSINSLQLHPWIHPCIVRLGISTPNFNKILIPGL